MDSVTITELKETITALIAQKVPTFLWGAPGIGKSSIIKQIASAYQLVLDRKVGEYELPSGWAIVAAGNREGDRGVTYRMPSPLANRFVHFEMDVHVDDWRMWAFSNGVDARIVAYIAYKKEHLFTFDAKSENKSFATPRSWEYVDKILKAGIKPSLLLEAIGAAVGKDVGVSFLAFTKVMNKLPDIEAILESGSGEYSDEVDVLYALSSGVVSAYLADPSDARLEHLLTYTFGLKSEFAVMIVQDLQRSGVNTPTHLESGSRNLPIFWGRAWFWSKKSQKPKPNFFSDFPSLARLLLG